MPRKQALPNNQFAAVIPVSDLRVVQRVFAGSLLTFMLEGLLGDPEAARREAEAHVPGLVRLLIGALTAPSGPPFPKVDPPRRQRQSD